jgi:hypothetical protein
MPRKKKLVSHYEDALARLAGLKAIDKDLDLGNGLTVAKYEKDIQVLRDRLDEYNLMLSQIDAKLNEIQETEKNLKNTSELILLGVAVKFGKDSNEYEQAGGIKKSERKKPVRKKKP